VDMLTQDLTHQLETTAALYGYEKAQKASISEELARCHQRIADLEKDIVQARGKQSSNTAHNEFHASNASSGENNQHEVSKSPSLLGAAKQGSAEASRELQLLLTQLEEAKQESSAAIQDKTRQDHFYNSHT
jgi:hypothetical protein